MLARGKNKQTRNTLSCVFEISYIRIKMPGRVLVSQLENKKVTQDELIRSFQIVNMFYYGKRFYVVDEAHKRGGREKTW